MGLLNNIGKTVSELSDTIALYRQYRKTPADTRSFNEWLAMFQHNIYGQQPDFLDSTLSNFNLLPQSADKYVGVFDMRVSPKELFEMVDRDTYVAGLFETLVETLFKNDFYVEVVKDRNGRELGSKRKAQYYTSQLKDSDFESLVVKQVYAERADGGGNALLYTVATDRGLEFRCEPFLYNGSPRVRVYGDLKSHIILKYEVLDEAMQVVHTLDPKQNYMKHVRYSQAGDFRFSSNPAKKAVYWYVLKKYLAGANVARFKNGLQDPVISTPDYTALTSIMNAMSDGMGKVSDSSTPEFMRNPLLFLAKQGVIDDELFRTITARPDQTNKLVRLNFPQKFERIGVNNHDMQVKELIALCDRQMGFAYRTSEGIINTQNSKYSNAEVERDNWDDLVVDPIKRRIEKIGESFYLPVIDELFDNRLYRLRFGRNADQEDLDIYNAKTTRNTSKANILVQLSSIPDVAKYNFDTDEIEPVIKPDQNTQNDVEPDNVEDSDDIVENTELQRAKKKPSISDVAVNSSEGRSFRNLVAKSINKQVREFAESIKTIPTTPVSLQSISKYGVSVNTYKQQLLKVTKIGYDEFLATDKKKSRAGEAYPQVVIDMLDAKAQLMVKGFGTLSATQKDLIRLFYVSPTQNREMSKYKGLDFETTNQVNTIIKNKLASSTSDNPVTAGEIRQAILDRVDELSEARATRIVNTEIAQSVQATRYNLYIEAGYDEKKWLDSGDDIVRTSHKENSAQGWIGVDEQFVSGAYSPADEIECRCDMIFRRA